MTPAERLSRLSADQRREVLAMLEPDVTGRTWHFTARPDQREPPGDWSQWLILSGRSWGKTRTGAETTNDRARRGDCKRISLVARTAADYRDTMIEGEALALDTPIPTPDGWATMGSLSPGDRVFAGNGAVTEVVAVSPIWYGRPCLALAADGADRIIADERHLWVTSKRHERRDSSNKKTKTRTTREIADTLVEGRRKDLLHHEIPIHGALDLPDRELPVKPYTLGAWLGDGDTRGHGTFTCHDDDTETVENIRREGYEVRRRVGSYAWGIRGLRKELRLAGVIGNKHIPQIYLRASGRQRLALLRGLMDTDGYVSARGQCSFDNTDSRLVCQVRELLLTLGYKPGAIQAKRNKDGHRTIYRIVFAQSEFTPAPFLLPRKVERCKPGKRPGGRLVRAVEPTQPVPTKCIQVAHSSGTFLAGRDMVVTHNSGILACSPPDWRPVWEPSKRELTWPNGTIAKCYSAEEPGQLRGPQSAWFWADEFASWFVNSSETITPQSTARAEKAWSNLMILNRLGNHPQGVLTTSPQPLPQIRALLDDPNVYVTRGTLFDNSANLSQRYLDRMRLLYEGTRLGRQELYGEILDDVPGALWQREWFDRDRKKHWPDLLRVVVGVDPAVTVGPESDETGIVVAGLGVDGRGYVIADLTCKLSMQGWAERAVQAFYRYHADAIVAERNNGGDLIEQNIRLVDPLVPVQTVWASRGKVKRAEPVALLYEKGLVSHVGQFDQLEDEMSRFTREGGFDVSPNRADAAVWALWSLFLEGREMQMGGVGVEEEDAVRISSV